MLLERLVRSGALCGAAAAAAAAGSGSGPAGLLPAIQAAVGLGEKTSSELLTGEAGHSTSALADMSLQPESWVWSPCGHECCWDHCCCIRSTPAADASG